MLGLRRARSHDLVAIDDCWIADPVFATAFDARVARGRRSRAARHWRRRPVRGRSPRVPTAALTTICVRLEGAPLDPSTHSRVAVRDHVYSVGPQSFWQSHRDAPGLLVNSVLEFSATSQRATTSLTSSAASDCSRVPLAKLVGPSGRVSAVESSPHAVRDARENAKRLRQLKVREWSVSPRSVNDTVREGSIVVLDPPRHGLAKGVAEAIVRRAPRRVVYVSCDAATFSRDLKDLLTERLCPE